MLGAIIGDMVGSIYEGKAKIKTKDFEILNPRMRMTDDSLLTLAVAKTLMKHYPLKSVLDEKEKESLQNDLGWEFARTWRKNVYAGFGGLFSQWCLQTLLDGKIAPPYHSFGNGSAMRISPVAYLAQGQTELESVAKAVTEITHDHPEGVKGAYAIAYLTYMALQGLPMESLKQEALRFYPEIAGLDFECLKNNYRFNVTCRGSVPHAIYCFLVSNGFEDTIRNCIAIGGDCDTTAAMAGAIAEAYYQKNEASDLERAFLEKMIDPESKRIIKDFYKMSGSRKLLSLD